MKLKYIWTAVLSLVVTLAAAPVRSAVLEYDIAWSGSNNYAMTGAFSFDSASAADGRIDETELLSLSIEGFHSGILVGSWALGDPYVGAEPFNFNFDPVAELFFVGGNSNLLSGQNWNDDGNTGSSCGNPGFGFNSGSGGQDICVDGALVSSAPRDQPLQVTRSVPEPTTALLVGIAALGLGWSQRKRA